MFGGNKDQPGNPFATASVFGSHPQAPSTHSGTFGTSTAPSSFGNTSTTSAVFGGTGFPASGFGQQPNQPGNVGTNMPVFGGTNTQNVGAANTSTPVFGQSGPSFSSANQPGSVFGIAGPVSSGFGNTTKAPPVYGAQTNQQNIGFGTGKPPSTSMFSTDTTQTSTVFGASQSTTPFGTSTTQSNPLLTTPQSSSGFGQVPPSASAFGTGSIQSGSAFGTNTTQSGSVFGTGTTKSSPGFGATTTQSNTVFGTGATQSNTVSGAVSTQSSSFGTSTTLSSSVFGTGGTQSTSVFGTKTTEQPASVFGTTPKSSTGSTQNSSLFGTATQSSSVFGATTNQSTPVFGGLTTQSSTGGTSTSVAPASQSSSMFGAPTSQSFGGVSQQASGESRMVFGGQRGATVGGVSQQASSESRMVFGGQRGATADDHVFGQTRAGGSQSDTSLKSPVVQRQRRMSIEDIQNKVALVCKNIPSSCFSGAGLRAHFSKYGDVTRVYLNRARLTATIHFADHESAVNAKMKGRVIKAGQKPMTIFWGAHTPKSPDTKSEPRVKKDELNDELESMAAVGEEEPRKRTSAMSSAMSRRLNIRRDRPAQSADRPRSSSPYQRERSPHQEQGPAKPRSSKLEGSSVISLKALSDAVGHSAGERIDILENRDKIVKMALSLDKSNKDLSIARVLKGTCQDMCPEKERYLREDRRRLSAYEIVPGTDLPGENPKVDHARAIKEYARSSADQEVPLPHELRPEPVLQMTMQFIVNNIADSGGDGKWEDWYEFLWNRTRGIRKDITQQQLCSRTSVGLVEMCARFHIYSAERLCEEPYAVFDQKINNENLTKCLQTLKEQYYDLESKQNVICDNEAEFRAYLVLMNLNEGDTLREVQQLRQEVRESPEVRFSVQVYSALNSNNYVKFFKLVHRASFLNACLMHRYFNQVRTRALLTMTKAYGVPGKKVEYPISSVVPRLGFEGDASATMFCQAHGLSVNDGLVHMDRSCFVQPDSALEPSRAQRVIETKQITSVGQVIYGEPLPPNIIATPHNSFDDRGRFKATDIAISQHIEKVKAYKPEPAREETRQAEHQRLETRVARQVVAPPPVADTVEQGEETKGPAKLSYTNDDIKDIAKELFLEVINSFCVSMASSFVQAAQTYFRLARPLVDEIIAEAMPDVCSVIAGEVHKDELSVKREREAREQAEREEQEARRRAELSMLRERANKHIMEQIVQEVVDLEVNLAAQERYSLVQDELRYQSLLRSSDVTMETLVREVVDEEIDDVTEEVHEEDVVQRLRVLAENERAVHLITVAKFFRKWRNKYARRLRLKGSMLGFPPAPNMDNTPTALSDLLPKSDGIIDNMLHLGDGALTTLRSPDETELRHQVNMCQRLLADYWERLQRDKAWAALDMSKVVYKPLINNRKKNRVTLHIDKKIYWKLLVGLPDHYTAMNEWVIAKLSKGTVPNSSVPHVSKILSLYHTAIDQHHPYSVSLCIRTVEGALNSNKQVLIEDDCIMQGSSALLFVCDDLQQDWNRLESLLCSLTNGCCIPLLILTTGHTRDDVVTTLRLVSLKNERVISDYSIVDLDQDVNDPQTSTQVVDGLSWLCYRCPRPPPLVAKSFRDYVEEHITTYFSVPVYQDLHKRRKMQLLDQPADVLIELYNTSIHQMADQATSDILTRVDWPPTEFTQQNDLPSVCWNQPDNLRDLQLQFYDLTLPTCDVTEMIDSWSEACQLVWSYVTAVVEDSPHYASLYSKIRWLLEKYGSEYEEECFLRSQVIGCDPETVNIPWTEIIMACVDFKIQTLYAVNDQYDETMVYYMNSKTDMFKPPPTWLDATRENTALGSVRLDETIAHSVKRKREMSGKDSASQRSDHKSPRLQSQPLNSTRIQEETSINNASLLEIEPMNYDFLQANKTVDEFNRRLQAEKKASSDFEEYLRQTIEAGGSDSIEIESGRTLLESPTNIDSVFQIRKRPPIRNVSNTSLITENKNRRHSSQLLRKSVVMSRSDSSDLDLESVPLKKSRSSIAERLEDLVYNVEKEKHASKIFEMKLQSVVNDTLFDITF